MEEELSSRACAKWAAVADKRNDRCCGVEVMFDRVSQRDGALSRQSRGISGRERAHFINFICVCELPLVSIF